jgi:aryl-alcohol dehydrogenase-like predicted oxidoreductase
MEYRRLGLSGLTVPALSFGTGTFGGVGRLAAWGSTDATEARRLVDICLDAGVSMFDTANVYSLGESERVLGQAIKGRRDKVLISTKATFRFGDGPNDLGSSRQNLLAAIDGSLGRLGTDYIDLFQLHGFDAFTPPEEVLATLDVLVRAGKIRYVGVSNFSGWHLMKSLAVADTYGFPRYVANQTYYSLIGRDYEWELMPLGLDQGLGAVVWSPLGWGRLTGKIALNWLLQRPTVATLIIGARNEAQLRENLGAIGWSLTKDQIARLDSASEVTLPYPYWHQRATFLDRNPPPV